MANGILQQVKDNWKYVLWGLIPLAIVIIVFALPIKVVPVQVTELYWDVEMKSEPYSVSETYTAEEPYTVTETRTENVYDKYVYSNNWSYTFNVSKPDTTVSVTYEGYSSYYNPYYFYCPDDTVSSCRIEPFFYYGGYGNQAHAVIKVSYPEEVTKYRTVTKTRDVTKYREVPTQVLKERTTTQHVRMSIWAYLFR